MKLADVDLTNPDLFQQAIPHETFEFLRREAPVFWHEEQDGPGFWAITKYADLKFVSRNPQTFSSERMGALLREPQPEQLPFMQSIMLNMDPPRHRQYRALVNKAFTKRMVENLHGRIRDMVTRLIDDVIERGECDFVDEVAAVLPMQVICEMMGVPEEDRRRVYEIGNQMVGFDDPDLQEGDRMADHEGQQAAAEMFMYATKLREKAVRTPGDDLATALVNAELEGEKLSESDFNFFFLLLLIAGNETTRTVTTNGTIALLDNPDQHEKLRQNPALVDSAVEEILRYCPAVNCFRRQTTEEVEIRGQKLRENEKVVLWYPSANRDEEVFHDPHRFDIERHPNEHLAFGVGEHFCLGSNLARLELREVFSGIVTRFHELERTEPPRRLRSTFINGIKEMQVRYRPGPRLGT
ncbi:MAG: cytochrome P450 [Proteobacteria bacterium]|nr:cytochrome P450 [Pseudomonadota bacterium]